MLVTKGLVLLVLLLEWGVTGSRVHQGHTKIHAYRRNVGDGNKKDFESLGSHGPEGKTYYLSKFKADRDGAVKACSSYSASTGKQVSLLVLETSLESDHIRQKLQEKSPDCVWISANLLKDAGTNTEKLATFSPSERQIIDVTGGAHRWKRQTTRKQRQAGGTAVSLKSIVYPYFEQQSSDGMKCVVKPKCEPAECTVTTPACVEQKRKCVMSEASASDCTIAPGADCEVSYDNCVITHPNCTVRYPPCIVKDERTCTVKSPECSLEAPPKCTAIRPACATKQPPCEVVESRKTDPVCRPPPSCNLNGGEPNCTYAAPKCTTDGKGVRTCGAPELIGCHLNPVCVVPRFCISTSPNVVCGAPITFCPEPTLRCDPPRVECKEPKISCTDPAVDCKGDPELDCTKPAVRCGSPTVKCPPVVARCPSPKLECQKEVLQCDPPHIKCNKNPGGECMFGGVSLDCPLTMDCKGGNCQCVKLAKTDEYRWVGTKCDDQCNVLCEG